MIPYGLPLIYSTIACDAAPSVRLFLLPLSPPPRGSLKTKEAHHDDEDSQQIRTGAVHRQRQLVSPFDQPQRSVHRRRAARRRARRSVLASGRNRDHSALQQACCRRGISGMETHRASRPKRYANVRRWQRQYRIHQEDRVHGFPAGRNHAVFRQQRDPSAKRVLTSASKPALASALARVFIKNSQLWVLSLPFHSCNDDVTISGSY